MTVRKLSSHVRSQLKSGLIITDATQCTLELVENSLDAKATAIAVRVNLSEFSIEVVDNGMGISSDDLKFIGKRYMTSKCHNFEDLNTSFITYGYKGQALASIAEICGKLTIKTKYKMSKETMIKIFRNGEPPSLFVSNKDRSDKGTTVTVHDFMCTMPVRRKRIFEVFDLQDIKNQMEYLAIIHNEVCFTLRDENKGVILLQTHKKTDPGLSLRDLFGLALDKFLIPFNYEEKNIAVHGYVSLRRHSESNLKFFYVNNRIVLKSIVHKLVNFCIDKYFKENYDILNEMSNFEGINLNLPKNNHNVYIVKIFCPYSNYVMFRNLRKTTVEFKDWDFILTCIKRAIKSAMYFKSSDPESDKIKKIPGDPKKVVSRNEHGNLKNGIKGDLVKRKFDCENLKQGKIHENSGHCTEGLGVSRNNFSEYNSLSRSELISSSESHSSGYTEAPKTLSESPVPRENYLNAKEYSVLSDLTDLIRAEKRKNMECTDFLDFLAWFRCNLKDDSKINYDFIKYKHNFRNPTLNNCSNQVRRKSLKNRKSVANKTKYMGVHKRKEEGNKKKEIKNSPLLQRSRKTRNTVVSKQRGIKGTKRKNCAQHSSELTSKKLKVGGKIGNNSSEDMVLSESRNTPLAGCWFSHQNRIHLVSEINDVETLNSSHLKLNVDECKKKTKLKPEDETQTRNNAGKGSKFSANETNAEYKDFGVQTDKDFAITPSDDTPNAILCPTSNIKSTEFQCETNSSFKDKELSGPISFELVSKHTYRRAKVVSNPVSSLQLNNLKTVGQEKIPFSLASKNPETMAVKDSGIVCELPSNKLSRGTAPEELADFPKMSSANKSWTFKYGSRSKLVHTEPLNFNSSSNRTVSPGRCSSHSEFTFTERYNFIPKGLSQSALDRSPVINFKTEHQDNGLGQRSDLVSASSRPKESGYKSMLLCNIFGELKKKTDENMIYYEKEIITANLINNAAEISSLGTVTIDKEGLSNIKVLGQWDKKFILGTVDVMSSKKKKFLAIFDQHAVDERVLLEKFLKEFRTSDGHFVSVCYDPPIKCTVKESVVRLLPSFENKLVEYGVKLSVVDHENVLLHEIPSCFADDNILEKAESFFQSLLNNLVEEINETRGAAPAIPKVYYHVISTKACKNAIKFNDALSNSAMKKMMTDLVKCEIPFQCAHGRPCIVPILDLEGYKRQFKQEGSKLNFKKFSTTKLE